jgi:SAM-dependent methyltransferase
VSNTIQYEVINRDIVSALKNNTLVTESDKNKYDLVVLFGVIHHIPSFELRKKIITEMSATTRVGGLMIISFWQFMETPLAKRIIAPKLVGIEPKDLEEHDFILDWKRGASAYRYCHFTDPNEVAQLTNSPQLTQITDFHADGQGNRGNLYNILRKNEIIKKNDII